MKNRSKTMDAMDAGTASDRRDMEEDSGERQAGGNRGDAHENAWNLLVLARQLIDQGKPSLSLQTVLAAMRSEGGEQAVFQTLNRARELYRNKMQANAAVDELASLFAECVIAEAQPMRSDPPQPHAAVPSTLIDANDTSILAMAGRKQIMLDAFADGSSFVCLQCGGLVSNLRKEEHLAYWCSQMYACMFGSKEYSMDGCNPEWSYTQLKVLSCARVYLKRCDHTYSQKPNSLWH